MPFKIVRDDITKMRVDAIVNPANPSLLGGGGVDGAIHKAAGPLLLEECKVLGGCQVGRAKISGAYNLPCRYVIHTVGPKWRGGILGERRQLASCYRAALELALENGCETIAFPLISSGTYGYPKEKAMTVAADAIGEFLMEHDMTVYLVVFGRESVAIGHKLAADIREYIDDYYVAAHESASRPAPQWAERESAPLESLDLDAERPASFSAPSEPPAAMPGASTHPLETQQRPLPAAKASGRWREAHNAPAPPMGMPMPVTPKDATMALDDIFNQLDESFQQMLLRKIDEKGMTDAQCYKKANIDRKLFSKIRNDVHYKPSKTTAIAFAIALELNLWETKDLLMKAGFALSHSSKFDVIIEYFIVNHNYNIFEINETLFYYDQSLLGG